MIVTNKIYVIYINKVTCTHYSNSLEFEIAKQIADELSDYFAFQIVMANFSLTWLVSMSIQAIIDEVKNNVQENHPSADQQLAIKWNRNYCLIFNFTDEINNFFGSVLLLFIGRQFFLCFDNPFQIMMSAFQTKNLSGCTFELSFIANNLFLLSLIIYRAQRMINKVTWPFMCLPLQWTIPLPIKLGNNAFKR